jgi:hypothetical protein
MVEDTELSVHALKRSKMPGKQSKSKIHNQTKRNTEHLNRLTHVVCVKTQIMSLKGKVQQLDMIIGCCLESDHAAPVCHTNVKLSMIFQHKQVHWSQEDSDSADSGNHLFLRMFWLDVIKIDDYKWVVQRQINKILVDFKIDRGANCSIITSEILYDKLKNIVPLCVPESTHKSNSGHRMKYL